MLWSATIPEGRLKQWASKQALDHFHITVFIAYNNGCLHFKTAHASNVTALEMSFEIPS